MSVIGETWRKSSYSNSKGGNCVEVRLAWHKSSYSNEKGGNCVEVAELSDSALMRDTRNRHLGHLGFPSGEWASFLRDVKADRL
ncbi:hypothetical protein HDA32_002689 [Spinactinospora alkalitolerans]|uniref:DUF397 domain-containing protein n=1 Tax=Spinactinospora alkalitolerans TaxID=687207 RepID=A0A852TU58_9ACTN|nr:DUF397 domain-containing protein [Spinactinospora alkalitolerans]NYE47569.1 hypothetical protein [Spinactinospora alkalitolerans]